MKISIITASYNNIETIEDTVKSVLDQSYSQIEYLVIDGLSTDGSPEMLNNKYGDRISAFISEKDEGMYDALNKGIDMATGDVIGFLHADDFYASTRIVEKVAECFKNNHCDAVYGDLVYVYRNNPDKVLRFWNSGEYSLQKMKKGWMPPHPTLFIKKDFYLKHGNFNTQYRVAADYELMTRFLCLHAMKPAYIPEVFIKMRWGGKSNKSVSNILVKMRDDYRAIRKNKVGSLFTLFNKNFSKISQFFNKK